jgi:hypothetical protein
MWAFMGFSGKEREKEVSRPKNTAVSAASLHSQQIATQIHSYRA